MKYWIAFLGQHPASAGYAVREQTYHQKEWWLDMPDPFEANSEAEAIDLFADALNDWAINSNYPIDFGVDVISVYDEGGNLDMVIPIDYIEAIPAEEE